MNRIVYLFRVLRYSLGYWWRRFDAFHNQWRVVFPDGSERRFQFEADVEKFIWYQRAYAKQPITVEKKGFVITISHAANSAREAT